jgi:hypothetical protein
MEEKVAWLDQDEEMAKWTEKENENISQYWGCFGRIPGVNDIKRVKVKRAARKELLDREDEVLLHSIDHAYEEEEQRRQQQLDEAHEWAKANEIDPDNVDFTAEDRLQTEANKATRKQLELWQARQRLSRDDDDINWNAIKGVVGNTHTTSQKRGPTSSLAGVTKVPRQHKEKKN